VGIRVSHLSKIPTVSNGWTLWKGVLYQLDVLDVHYILPSNLFFNFYPCIQNSNLNSFASVLVSLCFVQSLFALCSFLANRIRSKKFKMAPRVTSTSLVFVGPLVCTALST